MTDAAQTLARRENGLPVFNTCGTTFLAFGRAPIAFLGLSLVAATPTMLYLALLKPTSTSFTLGGGTITIVNLLVLYYLQIPMTYIAARVLEGQSFSMAEAFSLAGRRYLPVLGTTLVTLLLVYGGLILLIVPGLILACMYAVVLPVCILEGKGPIESMKRSAALTKYHRWRVLGIYVLFFLPLILLSGGIAGLFTLRGEPVLGQWISQAVQIVWVPLAAIFGTAIYRRLRISKENAGVAAVFE